MSEALSVGSVVFGGHRLSALLVIVGYLWFPWYRTELCRVVLSLVSQWLVVGPSLVSQWLVVGPGLVSQWLVVGPGLVSQWLVVDPSLVSQ
eukprot:g36046.t1